MKKIIKSIWRVMTYPFFLPAKLNRKFWLHASRRLSKIEQSELAKAEVRITELRTRLSKTEAEVKKLEAIKKQLNMELELELMDKYIE